VLLDVGLPDGSGLTFIEEVHATHKAMVLMVTTFGDRETVVAALRAGAEGYLLKDSNGATILAGIEATLAGGAPISPAAAVYLLDSLRAPVAEAVAPEPAASFLTVREVELLKLFAKGASYKEAARELDISPLTVGNHVKSIYRKLAVNSRGEAVYSAMRSGQLKV
jgi:DNA-binding NarL/FixJ family response regulator